VPAIARAYQKGPPRDIPPQSWFVSFSSYDERVVTIVLTIGATVEPVHDGRVHKFGWKRGDKSNEEPDMTNFRICGLFLAAATLLLATAAQAAVVVAPLETGTTVTKVAQGCGPGGWRGPYGHCHWGYPRRCWRGPYGGVHCG
jgi:hypothetical protein